MPFRLLTRCTTLAAAVLLLASLDVQGLSGFGQRADRRSAPGYLGITFRDIADEQVGILKLHDAHGVEIVMVDHDGPAFHSGLREHDVLLQINGLPTDSAEQFRRLIRDIPAGRTVALIISREGKPQAISAQLANRDTVGQEAWEHHITVPEPAGAGEAMLRSNRSFFGGTARTVGDLPRAGATDAPAVFGASYTGASLEVLGPQLAEFFGAQTGLLIREVEPNSPAALAGLRAGDVVVRLNAQPVTGAADWLRSVSEGRGRALPVSVLRERKEQVLTLIPDAKRRSSVMPGPMHGVTAPLDPTFGAVRSVGPEWR